MLTVLVAGECEIDASHAALAKVVDENVATE
jgi:hypothetical protein